MLLLFPVVFPYLFIRLIEHGATKRFVRLPHLAPAAPVKVGSMHVVAGRLSP